MSTAAFDTNGADTNDLDAVADPIVVSVLTPTGGTDGTRELPADIFAVQVNVPLIHQVVVAQLAAARQGTHSTKRRGEVSGGGCKPHKQKGTGRARQGSTRAPQFVGGGVVHGPKPRDYSERTPKKMKVAALRGVLSDRAAFERIHVLSSLVAGDVPTTRGAIAALAAVPRDGRTKVLLVVDRADEVGRRSLRNLDGVHLLAPDQLNCYDVLIADDIVFTTAALDAFLTGPIAVPARTSKAVARESELASAQSDGSDA